MPAVAAAESKVVLHVKITIVCLKTVTGMEFCHINIKGSFTVLRPPLTKGRFHTYNTSKGKKSNKSNF